MNRLVYFERHSDIQQAIKREKQIKRWRRAWKIALIEEDNPQWEDLYVAREAAYRRRLRLFEARGDTVAK